MGNLSILDLINHQSNCYGVDTETYNTGYETGLISIQVSDGTNDYYFTSDDFSQSESDIRMEICDKFFTWVESLRADSTLVFFNMDYDVSQFLKFMVGRYNYVGVRDGASLFQMRRGQLHILESESTMYKVQLCTWAGFKIKMIDIAKFLTATNLDTACHEWLGEAKIQLREHRTQAWIDECIADMQVKTFPKAPATPEQKIYAVKDAQLTYRLYQQLCKSEVIEPSKYVTIAGRTMGHFRDYLKAEYRISFNQFAYGTDEQEIVDACVSRNESVMRPSVRGGICRANRIGHFDGAHHLDAKSHYPSQMVKPYIPWGPILQDKPSGVRYEILIFPRGYLTLKEGKLPYLQWKRKSQCAQYAYEVLYKPGDYCNSAYLDGTYMFWGHEWDLVRDCYDFYETDEADVWFIEMAPNTILKPYIDLLFEGKENNTGTKKYFFKILLNSLYGKFLSRPDGIRMDYTDGQRTKMDETDRKTYYLPLGSWIATSGRVDLMRAMLSIPCEDVLYCDTDSIIYKGDKLPAVTLGKKLGMWDVEHKDVEVNIVGPKTYQERLPDGKVITKCAGLSRAILPYVPFGELREGLEVPCLKSHRDPDNWAISLRATTFEVSTKARNLRSVT